jgi:hypothetical protein
MEHRIAVIHRLPRPVEQFLKSVHYRRLAKPLARVFFDQLSEVVQGFPLRFG